jgi:hypothetical protein
MSHVLVVFQADTEHTEQLALAVGVGAVEAEASIRLRRLVAAGAAELGHKGYGTLKEADLLWADTVVVGLEGERPRAEELEGLLLILGRIDTSQLKEKQAWTFGAKGLIAGVSESQIFVESALRVSGFTVLPAEILAGDESREMMEQMKEAGRTFGKHPI